MNGARVDSAAFSPRAKPRSLTLHGGTPGPCYERAMLQYARLPVDDPARLTGDAAIAWVIGKARELGARA